MHPKHKGRIATRRPNAAKNAARVRGVCAVGMMFNVQELGYQRSTYLLILKGSCSTQTQRNTLQYNTTTTSSETTRVEQQRPPPKAQGVESIDYKRQVCCTGKTEMSSSPFQLAHRGTHATLQLNKPEKTEGTWPPKTGNNPIHKRGRAGHTTIHDFPRFLCKICLSAAAMLFPV